MFVWSTSSHKTTVFVQTKLCFKGKLELNRLLMMKAVVSLVLLGLLCSSVIQGKPVEKESQVDAAPEVGLTVLENEFREIAGDGSYEFK